MSGGSLAPGSGRVYEPVADIARGGMGRVELVVRREGSFARVYAMKRLRPELSEDREVREMFLEEARIAGLIRHPNVVPVLDVGEDELGPFLVMEYIEGIAAYLALVDASKSRSTLSLGLCAEIARQASRGLAAAHELVGAGGRPLSVVHRDISPQNILLGFDGLVRVTDFGVARALDRRADRDDVLLGKIGYVSPEQIAGQPLDARSDLFSFGVVLYELLTSRRLFGGDRDRALWRILHEKVDDVRQKRADVPRELAELVAELLAKSADARPASAGLVAARLEKIVEALREAGQDVSIAPFLHASYAEEQKRQRALVAAALERTEAGISLFDAEQTRGARPGVGMDADGPITAMLPGSGAAEGAGATLVDRDARAPRRQRLVPIAAAAGLLVIASLGAWGAGLFGAGDVADGAAIGTAATPIDPDACTDSASCRAAEGVASYCDAESRRCRSVISATCPEIFPADAQHDRDAIVLGTIFDRATTNQSARERAARLAIAGLNHVSGIDGRRVVLVHCDSSVAGASAAASELVRAGVPAIIGPSTSAEAESVFSSHASDGVLVISPSATATQLGAIDTSTPGLLWRTAPPDSLQATVVIDDLLQPPVATSLVVVRRSNDVYAQSLSVLVQEAATRAGLRVGASQLFGGDEAIAGAAAAAIASAPDAIFFVSSRVGEAAAFLDAASEVAGYQETAIYFPDVAAHDDLVALTTSGARLFPQVRATRPAAPDTIITREFVLEYQSAYGGVDPLQFSFTAHTYDATALVLLGVGYALGGGGELTGVRIAEGIRLVSSGSREHRLLGANLPATIAALRAAQPDVDVLGASGTLDFDPATEELTSASYEVLGVRGTPPRFEVLRTVDPQP